MIVRTAWNTRSDYLWAKYQGRVFSAPVVTPIAGPPIDPFAREALGAIANRQSTGFSDFERTLLRAADELHEHSFVRDETWAAMAKEYSVHQLMDATFTVAEMTMIAEVVEQRARESRGWLEDDGVARRAASSEPDQRLTVGEATHRAGRAGAGDAGDPRDARSVGVWA